MIQRKSPAARNTQTQDAPDQPAAQEKAASTEAPAPSEVTEDDEDRQPDFDLLDVDPAALPPKRPGANSPAAGTPLSVVLSQSLHRKLLESAKQEGVPVDDLVRELLAEGIVIRAWEIMERKFQMQSRQHPQQQGRGDFHGKGHFGKRPGGGGGQGGGGRGFRGPHDKGGRRGGGGGGGRPQFNIDDKAEWLEYLRRQEKGGRSS